ncbi:MAG: hypothetical protein KIG35_03525, partial [Prevotellamassilia sp.]|nr:hypothetical protein [Prevotellamassilia sp.]
SKQDDASSRNSSKTSNLSLRINPSALSHKHRSLVVFRSPVARWLSLVGACATPLAARRSPACLHPPSSLLEACATLQETATAFGGVFTAKTESNNHIAT